MCYVLRSLKVRVDIKALFGMDSSGFGFTDTAIVACSGTRGAEMQTEI
jgi:hypothetical protein